MQNDDKDPIWPAEVAFFFLEHAGELHIIVLVEEKESYIDPNTHAHTSTPSQFSKS